MDVPFDRDLYVRAWNFAAVRHNGQCVPGTALPYIVHVGAVAMEVLATLAVEAVTTPDLAIACALLHDTIEDTNTTADEIAGEFGRAVADGVIALSKDQLLPKAAQMSDSLKRIQLQPREVWIVKLADRTVNMEPAPAHWTLDKRRDYQRQARLILDELGSSSPSLAARLHDKIARYDACIAAVSG
jgi:(p)ppGpp synthase/HD superfamily hydrolase